MVSWIIIISTITCLHIDIIEPPSNVSISPTAIIADGQVVELQCSANQTFPHFYEWRHNGATVLGLKPDVSTLKVPATLATAGEYKCTVSNTGGSSDSDTAYIYGTYVGISSACHMHVIVPIAL